MRIACLQEPLHSCSNAEKSVIVWWTLCGGQHTALQHGNCVHLPAGRGRSDGPARAAAVGCRQTLT